METDCELGDRVEVDMESIWGHLPHGSFPDKLWRGTIVKVHRHESIDMGPGVGTVTPPPWFEVRRDGSDQVVKCRLFNVRKLSLLETIAEAAQ